MRKVLFAITVCALFLGTVVTAVGDRGTTPGVSVPSGRDTTATSLAKYIGMTNTSVSYVILVPQDYEDEMEPLADWKTQKGYNTAIFTVQDIYNAYTGKDNPDKIHNFLMAFRLENPTFEYLLLIGDVEKIPIRHLWTNGSQVAGYIDDTTPTDYYYAALDTTWNLDDNGKWGDTILETDWDPDVYVGRIPVDVPTEATTWTDRIIAYEKTPATGPWMERALVASALYDVPNVIGDHSTRLQKGYYEWWQDNGKEVTDIVEEHIPDHMNIVSLHDYNVTGEGDPLHYYGGNWSLGTDELSQSSFRSEFNKGNTIVTSASHAWIDGTAAIQYQGNGSEVEGQPNWDQRWKNLYDYNDAKTASNNGKFSFWYASACDIGNYSNTGPENTFEQFFHNDHGGVIGLIAAMHGDYRGEANDYNISDGDWWLEENFWEIFFSFGEQRPGKALYESKRSYEAHLKSLGYSVNTRNAGFARQSKTVYNLLGDPEVPVWTAQPGTLAVDHVASVYTGENDIEFTVTDSVSGAPVNKALVALMGDNVYARGWTASDGKVTIPVTADVPDTVDVTVTALNYLPLEDTSIQITWKPADLVIKNKDIVFDRDVQRAGLSVTATAFVTNIGESMASGVEVSFYRGNPSSGGTLLTTETIPSIAINITANCSATITAEDGDNVIYVVVDPSDKIEEFLEDNNGASAVFAGTGADVAITWDAIGFSGAAYKDGRPALANGSTSRITATVTNLGVITVSNLMVRFYVGNPDLGGERIGTSDPRITSLAPGASENASLNWTAETAGTSNIFVVLDPGDKLMEFDESNNKANRTVHVAQPPVWKTKLADIIMDEDTIKYNAFDLAEHVEDPDTDYYDLEFEVVDNLNPAINVTITQYNKVDITPDPDFSGYTEVTIAAMDEFFSIETDFMITVNSVNDAPIVETPEDVEIEAGLQWSIVINATDPEGDMLTYSASFDKSPLFTIDPDGGFINFVPKRSDPATNIVHIEVSDSKGAITTVTFTIKILKSNYPPTLEIPPGLVIEGTVGKTAYYELKVSDRDDDPLTFYDDFYLFDVQQQGDVYFIRFTPADKDVGEWPVTLRVNDGLDNATASFTVKISKKEEGGAGSNMLAGNMLWIIIAVIAVIIVVGVVMAARSRSASRKEEKEIEKMLDEKLAHKKREEEAWAQQEDGEEYDEKEEPAEDGPDGKEEAPKAAAGVKCPKCKSKNVQMFEDDEGICNKCGNMIKL